MNLNEILLEIIKELKDFNSKIVDYKKDWLGNNVPYQLCPKCNGDGNLLRYNSPAFMSTNAAPVCDVCAGNKIIPMLNMTNLITFNTDFTPNDNIFPVPGKGNPDNYPGLINTIGDEITYPKEEKILEAIHNIEDGEQDETIKPIKIFG